MRVLLSWHAGASLLLRESAPSTSDPLQNPNPPSWAKLGMTGEGDEKGALPCRGVADLTVCSRYPLRSHSQNTSVQPNQDSWCDKTWQLDMLSATFWCVYVHVLRVAVFKATDAWGNLPSSFCLPLLIRPLLHFTVSPYLSSFMLTIFTFVSISAPIHPSCLQLSPYHHPNIESFFAA